MDKKQTSLDAGTDYAKALAAFNQKEYRKSANFCRKAVKAAPDNVNILNLLAINAHNLKKFKTAARLYQIANKISPNNPVILNNQGSILRMQGDINGGIAAYMQAIAVAPQNMEARFNLARVYEDTSQPLKAMECYEKGIITKAQTGGIDLKFGNADAMLQVLEEIVTASTPLGKLLGQGSERAAAVWGNGAEECLITSKGAEAPAHMPQAKRSLGL
ncbi:MAG: aldehyde ferredoxin oxidoreductase C-terminal domain-containing protein, partial [Gammaproteobacteria bacterium]